MPPDWSMACGHRISAAKKTSMHFGVFTHSNLPNLRKTLYFPGIPGLGFQAK